ncbi:MAG TPA: hypothetical protein VMA09_18035 [Candidatus Binataceae bacterium]|nr:hypothetical protein [Candidatus Binataceae bacterium]
MCDARTATDEGAERTRFMIVTAMRMQPVTGAEHERYLDWSRYREPSKRVSGPGCGGGWRAEAPFGGGIYHRGRGAAEHEPLHSVESDQNLPEDESRERAAGHANSSSA